MAPFLSISNCTPVILTVRASYLFFALSVVTMSAMTIERYVGVLHPFQYQTQVTKKRIVTYVCGHGLTFILLLAYSFRKPVVILIYIRGCMCVFSVIFFWTKTLLRKEALKTLNYIFASNF